MDGSWCFRGAVAADMSRERKLLKKLFQALSILRNMGKYFAIATI